MDPPEPGARPVTAALRALHDRVDQRFAATTDRLPEPIGCGPGCSACCVDGLTVFEPEAQRIGDWVRETGAAIRVGPVGACAFLDPQGRCQVHPARPYVCRSQGAVLRWFEPAERRATCAVHLQGVDLHALDEAALFDLGVAESALVTLATQQLQEAGGRGLPPRRSLRALASLLAARPPSSSPAASPASSSSASGDR